MCLCATLTDLSVRLRIDLQISTSSHTHDWQRSYYFRTCAEFADCRNSLITQLGRRLFDTVVDRIDHHINKASTLFVKIATSAISRQFKARI